MEKRDIAYHVAQLQHLVYSEQIKEALDYLLKMAYYYGQPSYRDQIETITSNYLNLLKYTFEGYHDPKRRDILNQISASLLSMSEEIEHHAKSTQNLFERGERNLVNFEFGDDPEKALVRIDQLLFSAEMLKLADETGANPSEGTSLVPLFSYIWLTDKITEPLEDRLRKIVHSNAIEWWDKSLIVSTLTLSLIRYLDPLKFELLIEFYEAKERQVSERALVGLVIAMIHFGKRLSYYQSISQSIQSLSQVDEVRSEIEAIILQLLLAQETKKITDEFEKEILPEMKKMIPKIEDKLQLGGVTEEDDEEKNPGWKEIIDEVPGLFERIEKFTKMQMEGADVFMGTFSMLKNFPFFQRISNWLVPYYPSHPELKNLSEAPPELSRLLDSLQHAFYICNSDKYSFVLNFLNLPEQQQSMIVGHFESELDQMKELASEEMLLNQNGSSGPIYIQYIQDLYRFFKLFPAKNEFQDFFQEKIMIGNLYFYKEWFDNKRFMEKLASFYFDNQHYQEAIELYQFMALHSPPTPDYFEKTGFAYQKLGKYAEAVEYYKKAELFDGDRHWVIKKLGQCYMKLGDWQRAKRYLLDAVRIKSDDMNTYLQIGQCSLNLKEYDDALEYFGKVRYYQPDNLKALRPVAYCHFIVGKLEEADQLYTRILEETDPTAYDLLNAGHVKWCNRQNKEAIELYRTAFNHPQFSKELLMDAFHEDAIFLEKNGVERDQITLMLDYILFQN